MSVIILLPALVVILYNLRKRHFFAEHPADCWGEEPLPKPSWILVDEREDMESA
ncbi:MAG: hypothetical protein K8T89_21935 [Planctomycetes bacterium]|nr:hypothetical protein [Planctomycetota bacterium]